MKAKSVDQQIKECVKKVSDDDLKFISQRLSQRLCGDLGEALSLIQEKYPEINRVLSNASNSLELYNTIDVINNQMYEISNKRGYK
jgi:uncharacterized protein YqgV (UPF0045/DUF77 family)